MTELTLRKPVGLIAGLVNGAIVLSAIAGVVASLLASAPLWFMLGFEVVTLVAAIFGLLLAMGRFSDGPAIGLLCVVGAVAAGTILGDISTQLANPIGGGVLRTFGRGGAVQIPITVFMASRLGACVVLAGCAAWVVLHRRPTDSLRSLGVGLALGAVMLATVVVGWKSRSVLSNQGSFALAMGMFVLGVVALGLLAASVHYTIRAFEFGRLGRTNQSAP